MMLFLLQMTFKISLQFGILKKLFLEEEKKTTFWMPNRKKFDFPILQILVTTFYWKIPSIVTWFLE